MGTSISTPTNPAKQPMTAMVSQGELDRSFKVGFGGYRMRCQPATMHVWYIFTYVHENHKKSTFHVGKYARQPWMVWDFDAWFLF